MGNTGNAEQGRRVAVVGLLYNTNGMAAWCWEAAHALQAQGWHAILVATDQAPVPANAGVEILRIAPNAANGYGGGLRKYARLLQAIVGTEPDGYVARIEQQLRARGIEAEAYFLNQSTLVDSSVAKPQFVTAWSYPITLAAYLAKVPRLLPSGSARDRVMTTLSVFGWWRRDWSAYRKATCVLAVSRKLEQALKTRGVRAKVVHPGTMAETAASDAHNEIRIVMAALSLSEPRKRIPWMLGALARLRSERPIKVQLIGEADEQVRALAAKLSCEVELLGKRPRSEVQAIMRSADIFCFGSILDDWGYVLVEAMVNGMIPVAPRLSPFDEILGDVAPCYEKLSEADFCRAVEAAIELACHDGRDRVIARAEAEFSRQAFGRSLSQLPG